MRFASTWQSSRRNLEQHVRTQADVHKLAMGSRNASVSGHLLKHVAVTETLALAVALRQWKRKTTGSVTTRVAQNYVPTPL